MIFTQRTVHSWWFDPKVTAEIVKAIKKQGPGAYLRLTPREGLSGEIKLDWDVPTMAKPSKSGDVTTQDGHTPPGGDDSHMCPPDCG